MYFIMGLMNSYVELFDVACLLSRWEGFGLALPEYMLARKPIVASNVDAIPNIIRRDRNGLLVEVDNAISASEAVLRICREDGLKEKLTEQGWKDVHSKFDARRVAQEHETMFEQYKNLGGNGTVKKMMEDLLNLKTKIVR